MPLSLMLNYSAHNKIGGFEGSDVFLFIVSILRDFEAIQIIQITFMLSKTKNLYFVRFSSIN